jgi:hypothetical protein
MARAIRWQVKFKTLNEKDALIDIYEKDWTGTITQLEPAVNPITTEEDSDDDYLKPVRTQTGYLRVIDNGDLDGLMPEDNSQHYVELHIDEELCWCGYMQADTFSEDWDITPLITEFPLISPLGILEGVYLDQAKEMSLVKLGELLLECIESTGVDFNYIYFPKEVWYSENESAQTPFSVALSRQTFFEDNGSDDRDAEDWERYDADTCLSFLEEFCKFWGWTLQERQKTLYFVGKSQSYYITRVEYLRNLVYGGNFSYGDRSMALVAFSSLSLDGIYNKKEILQGVNKVKITSKINTVGTVVPSIDEGYMSVIHNGTDNSYVYGKEYKRVIAYESLDLNVSMLVYGYSENLGAYISQDYNYANMSAGIGAMYVKRDIYSLDESENKRNYNYKSGIWIINRPYKTSNSPEPPPLLLARTMPILKMQSPNAAKYSSGAFVVSAQVYGYNMAVGGSLYEDNGAGELEIKFRIGDKYWNGSAWGSNETWFTIQLGSENDNSVPGKILSTKTLDQPYNGADGYVMPINEDLSGVVELTIHATTFGKVSDLVYRNQQLYLDNLKVDYYKDDNVSEIRKSSNQDNVYVSILKRRTSEEKEIELKIASNNNNPAAYNTLSGAGRDVGPLYFIEEGASMLAEERLLGILKQVYGRTTEKLNITVERSELTPMARLTRDGKNYRVLSEKIEWADDSEEIMIENIPD